MATVTGATGCALLMTAGGAFAHECYIANRSDQGSMNAGNSQVWFAVDVVADLVGPGSAPGTAGCFRDGLEEAGLPTTLAIMDKVPAPHEGVLGSKNPNAAEKAGDGKGIDHVFSSGQFDEVVGVLFACGGQLPPDF